MKLKNKETVNFQKVNKEQWQSRIKKYLISDCAIRDSSIISLLLREDIEEQELAKLSDSQVKS